MASTRGFSGGLPPFPTAPPMKDIGSITTYVNAFSNWTKVVVDTLNKRAKTISYAPADDLPPLAGPPRLIAVPDDPVYGQVLAYNGVGTSGTMGWNRIPTVGTVSGSGISIPSGGTTSQVLGKHSDTDFDMAWQTPEYVLPGGGAGQVYTKNTTANYDAAWVTPEYIPAGGATGYALRKTSTADYAVAWEAVNELTAGGTAGQVLVKNSATNYDASWTNTLGTMTSPAMIVASGTSTFAAFTSAASFIGEPMQLANQVTTATVGTAGTASALPIAPAGYLHLLLNGGTFAVPYYNP